MGLAASWKVRWETWDLRGVILLSLFLQVLLIFFAPLRKRVSKAALSIPLWLAYLLADVTASFAVGLISKSQGDTFGPFSDPTILAFWAPFLLVHLGGPDTITAFALEDNELWLRHLLGLGFQCWAVVYAFFQSFPKHKLWIPSVLMFVVGLIKYVERTRALYLASTRRFKDSLLTKPDPGPNYAKLMDEYTSKKEAKLPTTIEMIPEPGRAPITRKEDIKTLNDLEVVQEAHKYFSDFKGLIADLIFSISQRNQSRDFFINRTPKDAFKVVEVELSFFYAILFTKAKVVQSMLGCSFRILSVILNVAALVAFCFMKGTQFENFDIGISYTLLGGAIALDSVAFLMILRSDWTAIALTNQEDPNCFVKFLGTLLKVDRDRWPAIYTEKKPGWSSPWKKIRQIVGRRWSESLSQSNLIDYCLHPRPDWLETTIEWFGLTNMLDGSKYVNTVDFTNDLRVLIYNELQMKSELADDMETAKEIFAARGDWILRFENCTDLLHWINDFEYDQTIILWHIATELCYVKEELDLKKEKEELDSEKKEVVKENRNKGINGTPKEVEETSNNTTNQTSMGEPGPDFVQDYRKASKHLSNYMLYLLIMQGTMLSIVAGIGQIRFRDTCAEAKKFFRGRKILEDSRINCLNVFNLGSCFCCCDIKCCSKGGKDKDEHTHVQACQKILEVNTEVPPITVKGDRSKSLLFDACMLAKELDKLKKPEKWKIISKVWVELLSYAASHCRANTHMSQLSKGGQLLTLVWLLMAHLGLGNQFQISEGHARAKLIVRK